MGERMMDTEGQVIMPFYLLCDVSGSMVPDMRDLNNGISELHQALLSEPIINDLVMLSIITFNHTAQTVVPLAAPENITLPQLTASGGTEYGPALREFHQKFQADRARLKGEGKRVYRPCVYFLTDGEPNNKNYLKDFTSLITKEHNEAYPYVCAFGFRDATAATLQTVAYPNFGEQNKRGRYFIAKQSAKITELLTSMVGVLAQSILQSGHSAQAGAPVVAMPQPQAVSGMVGSFV
ncbi:VWA domain-containing protein [Catellatospora sp. NPDC049111]|uniref:vWA domain-containing protein n=1 Tax=Catellatospora sp. NPDC049111 TaxID=3155271 RepID=UPI0034057C43